MAAVNVLYEKLLSLWRADIQMVFRLERSSTPASFLNDNNNGIWIKSLG